MHLLMEGWPVTACNREPWLLNMDTTTDQTAATCEVCGRAMRKHEAVQVYAGESIRTVEIDYWAALGRQYRYRYTRRNQATAGLHAFAWYQFSKQQRRLLLGELLKSGSAAWSLGLPGNGVNDSLDNQDTRRLIKTARNIAHRVAAGKQDRKDLGRVVEILNRLGRDVAG